MSLGKGLQGLLFVDLVQAGFLTLSKTQFLSFPAKPFFADYSINDMHFSLRSTFGDAQVRVASRIVMSRFIPAPWLFRVQSMNG
jgi:hypothetical protein